MTMSHLLRRTKKCCLKLFRKLSINTEQPTTTTPNNRLSNSRTAKYFKYKTKTSSQSSSSSIATTKRRKITSSSPKFKSKKLKSYIKEDTSTTTVDDDEDADDKKSENRDGIQCVEDNENNNKTRINKSSQTVRNVRRPSRAVEYKHRNCCSNNAQDNNHNSNDNSNFFRFNKDYLKNYFNFYKLSQNNKMITNNLSECRDKNQLNNDFYLNKMFDDDNIRFTDNKIYIDKNNLKSCCSKIQFNNHNINNNTSSNINNNNNNEIIFEKVIYDKNKKYLSHSPTASIVPSPAQSIYDNLNNDNLFNSYKNDFFIFDSKNKSITSLYDIHHHDDDRLESYDPWSPKSPPLSLADPFCERNSCTLTSKSSLSFCSFDNELFNNDHNHYHHHHNHHHYDLQSNDGTQQNSRSLHDDPWSAFDLKTFDLKNKSNSMKLNRSGRNLTTNRNNNITNNEGNPFYTRNNWCNNKISSSTLETWIDDEVFDNSFNEELEKRCAVFEK